MRRTGSAHGAALLAAVLVLAGFVLIFLGWQGGAATLFVPTQIAYGVSGGMVGLALVGTGGAVAFAHGTRLATARRSRAVQGLLTDTVEVLVAVRDRTAGGTQRLPVPLPALPPVADARPATAVASSNGHAALDVRNLGAPDVLLMAGGKTYHGVGCRIVSNPDQALRLTVAEAHAAGLRPCRICGGDAA